MEFLINVEKEGILPNYQDNGNRRVLFLVVTFMFFFNYFFIESKHIIFKINSSRAYVQILCFKNKGLYELLRSKYISWTSFA